LFGGKLDMKEKKPVNLQELIRRAYSFMKPYSYHDDINWLSDKGMRDQLMGKYPKCWLRLMISRKDIPFFPVCNRLGMVDPEIISFSIKLASKIQALSDPRIDMSSLDGVVIKLNGMHKKYSKEVPKPEDMAYKKAKTTRMLSNIRKYLSTIRGE